MFAHLLQHPDKMHTLIDDLKPSLHVLSWMMLRYVPLEDLYTPKRQRKDLSVLDEYYRKDRVNRAGTTRLRPSVQRIIHLQSFDLDAIPHSSTSCRIRVITDDVLERLLQRRTALLTRLKSPSSLATPQKSPSSRRLASGLSLGPSGMGR